MTAFGRATVIASFGRLVAEVQSVNRRFLEMTVQLPKELAHFEMDVRRWISESVGRGQVTIRVEASFEAVAPIRAVPNLPLARQLKQVWQELGTAISLEVDSQSLVTLLSQEDDLIHYETDLTDEAIYRDALHQVVQEALKHFSQMRKQEGQALASDILMRVEIIQKGLERIEQRAGQATEKYRQRLMAKIQEFVPELVDNEERVMREVCIFADRCDYTEELIRFKSHLQQLTSTVDSDKPCMGKTLDFLLQELNRECNTIGSKAMDSEIAQDVVALKAELERIREQLQNVE